VRFHADKAQQCVDANMTTGSGKAEGFPTSHFRLGAFERRHYAKAPIIEAIISFTVELPKRFEIEDFRGFRELEPSYVETGEERMFSIRMPPAGSVQQSGVISGIRFLSPDSRYVLACRDSSFGVSRLAPYEDWEKFRSEARRLWGLYSTRFSPIKVTALSVRYINRIEIPSSQGKQIDFRWYFRTFPEISADLDVGMAGFHMRLDIPLASINARLILNQALLPPASPSPSSISVLLDSDIVSGLETSAEEAIWERCEVLRTAKNDVFEACITNLTRELFK
jgi:uncharacterized protein (TIGR04255 family)